MIFARASMIALSLTIAANTFLDGAKASPLNNPACAVNADAIADLVAGAQSSASSNNNVPPFWGAKPDLVQRLLDKESLEAAKTKNFVSSVAGFVLTIANAGGVFFRNARKDDGKGDVLEVMYGTVETIDNFVERNFPDTGLYSQFDGEIDFELSTEDRCLAFLGKKSDRRRGYILVNSEMQKEKMYMCVSSRALSLSLLVEEVPGDKASLIKTPKIDFSFIEAMIQAYKNGRAPHEKTDSIPFNKELACYNFRSQVIVLPVTPRLAQ